MERNRSAPHTGYSVEPEEADHASESASPPDVLEFVQQIKETADKLLADKASRGDIKLLCTAIKELRYSFKVMGAFRNKRKVTVFGSARTKSHDPTFQAAVEFGKQISQAGYMVITGAGNGIMEAGHLGAGRDNSIGINILLPFEQAANSVIANDTKLMHLRYFFTRKLLFVKETDGVALFPGGFGTLDEGFEVLTLIQTGKSHMFPIVFVDTPGGGYWKPLQDFVENVLLKRGLISPADTSLYKLTESVESAVQEITHFYHNYHSMRYVRDSLLLRMQRPLSESTLNGIRKDFRDILVHGTFEMSDPHPHEANEASTLHLPRLRFHFDRKNLGRLRMLIDVINME